jgi:hypothetical protein
MRTLALLTLVLLAPLAAAQGETSEQGAGEQVMEPGRIKHPPPGPLAKGDAIVYDWRVLEAGGRLFFSTHIHQDVLLINLTEDVTGAKQGRLVADRPGLYSLLWENQGNQTVTLRYEYHTEKAPSRGTPAPAWLALAGLAGAAVLLARRR